MKKLFPLIAIILILSCNNKSDTKKIVTYDTSNGVLGYFVAPDLNQITYAMVIRIKFYDSLMWRQNDSANIRKEITSDSFYFVPHYPSWQDTTTMLQHLDSAAGRKKINGWWLTQKQYVRGGWDSRDSALKYLQQFIKPKK